MGKHRKIYSSQIIGGCNAANTTRGIRRTGQVNITDDRVPIIYGVHRHIRGRLWQNVDWRYIGTQSYSMETMMYSNGQSVTNNTEKTKGKNINSRHRNELTTIGMDSTLRSGGTLRNRHIVMY